MTSRPGTEDLLTSFEKSGVLPPLAAWRTCEKLRSSVSSKPQILASLGRLRSKSTCRTFLPVCAWEIAMDVEVIVLPSPGCVEMTRTQCVNAS